MATVCAGKQNSSLNTSASSISSRSASRLASSKRMSGIASKPLEPSASFSRQGKKGSEFVARPVKATPIKRTETGPSVQHQTSVKRTMERATSVPSISTLAANNGNAAKVNSSLKAFVAPTPTNSLKGVRGSEGKKHLPVIIRFKFEN